MGSERTPFFLAFKGPNNKYLGYVKNGECTGHLKFCYDQLTNPFVKHEVVEADNGYAHIKCCYNNRYWRKREELGWIVAAEDSPNTDFSGDSCTLFELIKYEEDSLVSLRSLRQNVYAVCEETGHLVAGEKNESASFAMYNVADVVKLPNYVTFKGTDGRFLTLDPYDMAYSRSAMHFSPSDPGANSIRHQVMEDGDGRVIIEHLLSGGCWLIERESYYNRVGIDRPDFLPEHRLFQPIKIDDGTIALRSVANSKICRRVEDHFDATADSLEAATRLSVAETALRRRVHTVKYDCESAKIYDFEHVVEVLDTASNHTRERFSTDLSLKYTQTNKKAWNNSNSLKAGVSATFEMGIPFVEAGKIKVTLEDTFTWNWGEEKKETTALSSKYSVKVDPGKKVELIYQATKAKCDIKFSYIQEDFLTTGETVSITLEDGVFKGVNYFDIQISSKESII